MAQTNPWELPVASSQGTPSAPRGVVIPKSKAEIAEEERQAEELDIKKRGEVREEKKFERQMQDLTEGQSKAVDFYQRGRSSQIELERLNLNPDDLIALATQEVLPSNLANRFSDTDRRLYRAAAKNFAMATLRRESGAQIAPDEIANQISIFFPGAGADEREKQVLKRQRDLTILGLGSAAGPYGLEQANKNLQSLGFIDEQGNPIIPPAAAEAETPVAGLAAARPGERVVAEQDLKNARELQAAWQANKSIEELNAISMRNVGSALTPETIKALQEDTDRKLQFVPYLAPMEDVTKDMGLIEGAIETVTGSERSTPEIEAAPDWTTMPELNELSLASAGTALGTMFTSPEESVQIIQANYPGVDVRQDAKGNYILRSQDGKEYGIKPGFRWSDIPRAAGGIFAFTPAGAARTVAGAAGGAALTQAGIEATQAATGGTFDPAEIALAGAGGAGGQLVAEAIPAVVSAVRNLRRGPAGALPEAIPVPSAPEAPSGMGMPTGAPSGMTPPTAGMAPRIAGEAVEDVAAQIGSEEMINLAQKAVSRAPGASKARAELAELAKTNPEAKAAADRLGLELPVDVLSDNSQLKEVVGLTRAQIGSEAKQAWNETVQAASDRAHTAMDELDAVTDISQVSADVFDRLDKAQMGLGRQASDLRQEVTDAVDVRGRVDATGIKSWLQTRIDDLGGGKEGIAALSPEEKRLWGIVSKGQPTYALLNEQRDLIGQALEKGTGPWSNTNMKRLKDIYGSLADDQIKFIEASAGKEIADKQRAANTLFKQMYDGREQMERIFTKNLSGSLAPLMQRAITQGTKGNVQTLNTLVNIIPEDMRGKVLTSALFKAAKATDDTFSFTNFANIYRDLRANGAVYKQIAKAVGPEGDKLLTDLYAVSRRLSDADKAISRTGASTQLQLLNSERLLSRILMATGGAAGAGLIGSMLGGPGAAIVGAGLAAAAPEIAQRVGKTNAQKLHNLISSEPFRDLTVSAATGDALERNINRVAGSKQFRDYAKLVGIDMNDARDWLNSAISKGATIAGTEAVGEKPMEAPTVEMPQ